MIRDGLRRLIGRLVPALEVPLPPDDELNQLELQGRMLRAIVRSRGGQIVVPRSCWSTSRREHLVLETSPEGLVLRFADTTMIDPAYSGGA